MIMNIVHVVLFNLIIGLLPFIDNWGHVGGLAGGLALGWWSTPLYRVGSDIDNSLFVEDTSSLRLAVLSAIWFSLLLGSTVALKILTNGFKFLP